MAWGWPALAIQVGNPAADREIYRPSEAVEVSIHVTNDGQKRIQFIPILDIDGPNGEPVYRSAQDRAMKKKKVQLAAGKSETLKFKFDLSRDAPSGTYRARVALRSPFSTKPFYRHQNGELMDVFKVGGGAAQETAPVTASPVVAEVLPPAPEIAGTPEEQIKTILMAIKDAYAQRDIDGIVRYFSPDAIISLPTGRQDVSTYRRTLGSTFMAMDDPRWDYEIVSVSPDLKSGVVRVRVQSTYSANLVELIGVNPAALQRAGEPPALQSRILESFKTSAAELFEFRPDASGQMRIVELASALRLDPTIADQMAELSATWEAKVAVVSLFYYLEEKEIDKFADMIHEKFINNDDNSFNHGKTEFLESIRADVDHLSDFDHSVRVESILFNSDRTEARIPVTWDRRARIGNTRSEWTVKDRKTTFILKRGSGFKLAQIEGNPLFGNSSFLTRKTLINAGEVDAAKVTKAIVVDDKRETAAATSADVPELPAEQLSALSVSTEITGSISSSPTSDQTWTGSLNITTSITIPAGVTITVKATTVTVADNATVTVAGTLDATSASTTFNMGSSAKFTVNGTMKATSATFTGAGWHGIVFQSGSIGTLTSSTVSNATGGDTNPSGVKVLGGTVTATSVTLTGNTFGYRVEGGSLTISGGTVTGSTSDGLFVSAGTVSASDMTISSNTGEGVHTTGGTVTLTNSTVQSNGTGGIEMSGGTVTVTGGTISSNTNASFDAEVDVTGGALSLTGSLTIDNANQGSVVDCVNIGGGATLTTSGAVTIRGAGSIGQGVDMAGGTHTLGSGLTITSNAFGGLRVNTGANVTATGITVTSNSNGGIQVEAGGVLTIISSSSSNNTGGGLIAGGGGNIAITNCNFQSNTSSGVAGNGTSATASGWFMSQNNGDTEVTLSIATPTDTGSPAQYSGMTSVVSPRSTAN